VRCLPTRLASLRRLPQIVLSARGVLLEETVGYVSHNLDTAVTKQRTSRIDPEPSRIPRIVISCGLDPASERPALRLWMAYVQMITRAGGLPLPVVLEDSGRLLDELLDVADGVLLTGGEDLHPREYGDSPHPGIARVCPMRDRFEMALAKGALRRRIPVLGICRGMQILGAAEGVGMIQELSHHRRRSPIEHRQTAVASEAWHPIHCAAGSLLRSLLRDQVARNGELWVNSFHHQALRQSPSGWEATAFSPDGILEGMENPSHPFAVGVQWHPEEMPAHLPLFVGLVHAAAEAAKTRSGTVRKTGSRS